MLRRLIARSYLLFAAGTAHAQRPAAPPRVFASMRAESLVAVRARVGAGNAALKPAMGELLHEADVALAAPLVAVTDKHTQLPPTGNKHDYYSLSPYWWPDSTKPDGLPYVRHDGVTNPESKRDLDQPRIAAMCERVSTLALAYYLTGNAKYANQASRQLRTWFLDSATMMTPHLRFAQLVRGNPAERGSGIVDTRGLVDVVDAIGLLQGSASWTDADQRGMQRWMSEYLKWLLTSPNGRHEHDAKNNHGSWYAAQTATMAMFIGDTATARQIVTDAKARVGWQITPAGEQPLELERTKSMHYSSFNVEALSRVAEIGRLLGVDLWNYQAPEGGSLRKAIDNLAKYAADPKAWPDRRSPPSGSMR